MSSAYTYVYLVGSLLFVPIWVLWYWRSPASRREMLIMSGIFICIGVPSEALLYTRDWWHPATVTGTLVGVEDILYSIGNGGYMAALYAVMLRRQLVQDRQPPAWPLRLAPILVIASLPFGLCLGLGLHSFVATSIGSLVALAIVLVARPDLARVALVSGLIGTVLAIPVYLAMEALFPGSIAATWDLPHLSGIQLLGIPVEDLLWYVYTAALWGTYYKFASGVCVVPSRISSAHRLGAVQRLADDVGVAGVLRGFGDQMEQDTAGRPAHARLEPGRLWERVVGVQVGQAGHNLSRSPGNLSVVLEQAGERVFRVHVEQARPLDLGVGRGHRVGSAEHEVHPTLLRRGNMLDQAAQAQGASGGALRRLGVCQVADGEAQEVPMPVERFQEIGALASADHRVGGHGGPPLLIRSYPPYSV
jgi:hypothetical protein